ncbi:MAG: hypothetical protein ABMA25_12470 [Ilumatobacteraceae bacterium]
MDTPWLSIDEAAEQIGVSRQAVTQAARDQLERAGLARRAGARWELAPEAVDTRVRTGKWPSAESSVEVLTTLLVSASERADMAVLHASLARQGELEARLREREARVEFLESELEQLRAEFRSVLLARAQALGGSR